MEDNVVLGEKNLVLRLFKFIIISVRMRKTWFSRRSWSRDSVILCCLNDRCAPAAGPPVSSPRQLQWTIDGSSSLVDPGWVVAVLSGPRWISDDRLSTPTHASTAWFSVLSTSVPEASVWQHFLEASAMNFASSLVNLGLNWFAVIPTLLSLD